MARVFSPGGRSSRIEYLPIFLIWLLGTIFVQLAGGDVRREFGMSVAYPVVGGVTALLAWLIICATMRRLQDLNWSWLLALPWMLISLWPMWGLLGLRVPVLLTAIFSLYTLVTACLFLFLPGRLETPPIPVARPIATVPAVPIASGPDVLARENQLSGSLYPKPAPQPIITPPPATVAPTPIVPPKASYGPVLTPQQPYQPQYQPPAQPPPLPPVQQQPQPSPPPASFREFLVGWLVVESGANRGQQYRLRARAIKTHPWSMDVGANDDRGSVLDSLQIRFEPGQLRYRSHIGPRRGAAQWTNDFEHRIACRLRPA